jgi:hypothetical protein
VHTIPEERIDTEEGFRMNNTISFEFFKRQLIADKLTNRMMRDARIQKELHDIYNFKSTNRYKLFLAALFYENHKIMRGHSLRTGFLVGFDSDHITEIYRQVQSSLDSIGREYIIVEANGKSFVDCVKSFTRRDYHIIHDAFVDLKEILLDSNKVVVFKEFSKSKIRTRGKKCSTTRSIIKILHDAHLSDTMPLSDLIFIDYADFLQHCWHSISPYLKIMS